MNVNTHMTLRHSFLASLTLTLVVASLSFIRSQNVVFAMSEQPRILVTAREYFSSKQSIDMHDAIEQRKNMLSRSVHVTFVTASGGVPLSFLDVHLKDNPLWITFDVRGGKATAIVDASRIKQYLISYPPQNIPVPESCAVLSVWTDQAGVQRAQTDCIAKSGFLYNQDALIAQIKEALQQAQPNAEYVLEFVPAVMTDVSEGTVTTMKLLSTGRSTFEGSGGARKSNVRKALNERVNNVLIPTDAVFSFNDTLGTVSVSKGWQMALTIFEGANLRPAPGGGICQASTTTYRSALAAGLPIVEQKSHSLYVTYYEKFGVGQDATIFPGQQDLKFRNDTGAPLLLQSYNQGDEAFVSIFGKDDGRTVSITGPYFGKTAPKDLLDGGRILRNNEIGWVRTVTMNAGTPVREVFIARYKAIPKSLSSRSELTTVITRGEEAKNIVASDH